MARITQQSSIHTTGVSYENEPIIRGDGAGQIMQWQPSDGGTDGIYIIESVDDGPAFLGIGVAAPTVPLEVTQPASDQSGKAAIKAVGTAYGSNKALHAYMSTASATKSLFYAENSSGAAMNVKGDGTVAISGTVTVGSLDIGHGANGDAESTAVGDGALDANGSATTAIRNTAIGHDALTALNNNDADHNTAVGHNAGAAITSGYQNTFVGSTSGQTDTGIQNTAVGYAALNADCANYNTAVGRVALNVFTGSDATAVGAGAADVAGSQTNLTAIGKDALGAATSGNNCTAVGKNALGATVDGAQNTAVGTGALAADCGDNNTAVGSGVLDVFTGSEATAVGRSALAKLTTGTGNTAVGYTAGQDTYGDHNAFVGYKAGLYASDVDNCIAIGSSALQGWIPLAVTCTVTNTDATVTCSSSDRIDVGHYVTGTGVPAGTTVASINAGTGGASVTSFEMSAAATASGSNSLTFWKTVGDYNIAIGTSALGSVKSGSNNVCIGYQAGTAITDNTDSIAIGREAMHDANGGELYNIAIGSYSLSKEVSGADGCVAIGYAALEDQNIAAANNVAIGFDAAKNLSSGQDSVYVGYMAGGIGLITGGNNTVMGYAAGYALTGGASNVLIGKNAGVALTDSVDNIAIGHGALAAANTTGGVHATTHSENYNIAIGKNAMGAETSRAEYCVAVGTSALAAQNYDVKNTAIGGLAGDAITSADGNTLVGYQSGSGLVDGGHNNTAVGHMAFGKGTGGNNTCIGWGAGSSTATTGTAFSGIDNVIVGYAAGYDLTTGPGNVLIGRSAGSNMTTGEYNIAIGHNAADAMDGTAAHSSAPQGAVTSNDNIAIGKNSLTTESSGARGCIAIGKGALSTQNSNLTSGGRYSGDSVNLAIGYEAGYVVSTGTQNVVIGHQAGKALADDSYNTALGYAALTTAQAGYNTAIGANCMIGAITGGSNTAMGSSAMGAAAAAMVSNTAIGAGALYNLNNADADNNVALGAEAGRWDPAGTTDGTDGVTETDTSVYLGAYTRASARTAISNEVVIGYGAIGEGDNTVRLGNSGATAGFHTASALTVDSDKRIKRDIVNNDTGLALIEKLQPVTYKPVNPADFPDPIAEVRFKESTYEQLVTPAVDAADEVWEDVVVQDARAAVEEVTRDEVHPAVEEVTEEVTIPAEEAVYEDRVVQEARDEITEERVTQEAREEIKGERHKYDEVDVSEEVETVEMVKGEGDTYIRKVSTETVTRTERTPLYDDHPVVNEDGSPCVDGNGDPVIHKCPVMEEYIVQEACDEVRETFVVQTAQEEVTERVCVREAVPERTETRVVVKAQAEWTETHIVTPAEPAREEIKERRLVSAAVEAKDAVYETVTVPADDRPDDDDTVRLGLIAQDVQTAMTEAGVEFDLVNESPNGKLSLKYGNLVMPLIKAVQELSARVKTLEG